MLGLTQWYLQVRLGFAAQTPRLFLWAVVCFGTGAGLYYRLPFEPQFWTTCGAILAACMIMWGHNRRPVIALLALVLLGYGWAGFRSHVLITPILEKRMYGDVQGQVVGIDQSASGKPRVMLDTVTIADLSPDAQPRRVRIALHGPADLPAIGSTVQFVAHLSPPPGPAEPGGFDFQRHAWFLGLGGVGYTRKPFETLAPPTGQFISRLRDTLGTWVRAHLPNREGGVATAITTGEKAYLDDSDVTALRQSNLAHLLAISGLHMGLLAGLVFTTLRLMFLAVRWGDPKRIAAAWAIVAATAYLMISGASIATERAYVMAIVMLGAVMLRQRALTLRAIGLAAWIVLILRPQAVFSPGFHMSFAATTALVVVFQFATKHHWLKGAGWRRAMISAVLSSLVAGLATAPFAAAHFNQIPHYGLAANLVAVPLMGFVVMPGVLLAVALAPIGAEALGFQIVEWGLRAILWIAWEVSSWPGSVSLVKAPGPWVLPAFTLGALVLLLWTGWGRAAGALICAAALWGWSDSRRPDVLIADSATLIGVLGQDGRHLSRDKGAGFAARIWLENDGDAAPQAIAASRVRSVSPRITWTRKAEDLKDPCDGAVHVVADYTQYPDCDVFDLRRLRRIGSVAGYVDGGTIRWVSAKDITGRRLWNDRWVRRDALAAWPFVQTAQGFPD